MIRRTLLTAISTAVAIAPCFAEPLDSRTPCSVAVKAFNSVKRPGQVLAGAPSPEVPEVGNYILSVMEGLDHKHTDIGEPGVWSNLSDAARHAIAASAVGHCRLHPRLTINRAADAVYNSVRDIQLLLGPTWLTALASAAERRPCSPTRRLRGWKC
jgi:hypothetical protein